VPHGIEQLGGFHGSPESEIDVYVVTKSRDQLGVFTTRQARQPTGVDQVLAAPAVDRLMSRSAATCATGYCGLDGVDGGGEILSVRRVRIRVDPEPSMKLIQSSSVLQGCVIVGQLTPYRMEYSSDANQLDPDTTAEMTRMPLKTRTSSLSVSALLCLQGGQRLLPHLSQVTDGICVIASTIPTPPREGLGHVLLRMQVRPAPPMLCDSRPFGVISQVEAVQVLQAAESHRVEGSVGLALHPRNGPGMGVLSGDTASQQGLPGHLHVSAAWSGRNSICHGVVSKLI
jgi:hypothetical protein